MTFFRHKTSLRVFLCRVPPCFCVELGHVYFKWQHLMLIPHLYHLLRVDVMSCLLVCGSAMGWHAASMHYKHPNIQPALKSMWNECCITASSQWKSDTFLIFQVSIPSKGCVPSYLCKVWSHSGSFKREFLAVFYQKNFSNQLTTITRVGRNLLHSHYTNRWGDPLLTEALALPGLVSTCSISSFHSPTCHVFWWTIYLSQSVALSKERVHGLLFPFCIASQGNFVLCKHRN